MSENSIHTQVTYDTVLEALTSLPQGMTGDSRATKEALKKCGLTLLGLIRDAFVVKSMGGTDEAGDRWAPLAPATVAQRARKRSTRTVSTTKRRKGETSEIYNASVRRAKTLIKAGRGKASTYDKYARRDKAILHDSGKLLESLTPNSQSPDQVFDITDGAFSIGTRRVGAAAHHSGVSGKLPQRRLWPDPNTWPQSWWDAILKDVQDGMTDIIKEVIRGAM